MYILCPVTVNMYSNPHPVGLASLHGEGGVLVGSWNTLFIKSRKQPVDFNNLFSSILVHADARNKKKTSEGGKKIMSQ
jgi:hypothetical protein